MSSISENRNPNSETSLNMISQSSTSHRPENSEETEITIPNWLELPEDVWFMILSKIQTIFIIENAQKVCMLFRKLCKQPAMFKTIDMLLPVAYRNLPYDVNKMTRFAVDRSAGGLVDISLQKLCDKKTLLHIVDRSKNLKRLVLQHYIDVSEKTVIKAVGKLPLLEELQIIVCKFSYITVESIGRACPSLKSFSINDTDSEEDEDCGDSDYANDDCEAIARSMPQLRHLQLVGSKMTNEGLEAILDGCPLLESLDLRACFHIDLSGEFGARCKAIKHVRYPNDSTKDCGWQGCTIREYDLSGSEQEGEYTYKDYMNDIYAELREANCYDYDYDDYRFDPDYNSDSLGYESYESSESD